MKNRLTAGLQRLLLLNYRRARRWYWELRAPELLRLYGQERSDFPILSAIIERQGIASVLDLGCGNGRLFALYQQHGIDRVMGVDISARALEIARHDYPAVPTQRAAVEDFVAAEPFDLVVINRVFQHLPPEKLALAAANSARSARRLIYLNEIGETDSANLGNVPYMFKHDYPALFALLGWSVIDQNIVPGTRQTYLLFAPAH